MKNKLGIIVLFTLAVFGVNNAIAKSCVISSKTPHACNGVLKQGETLHIQLQGPVANCRGVLTPTPNFSVSSTRKIIGMRTGGKIIVLYGKSTNGFTTQVLLNGADVIDVGTIVETDEGNYDSPLSVKDALKKAKPAPKYKISVTCKYSKKYY